MTDAERQAALDAIAAEVAVCTRCRLHEGRTRSVPGEGSAETEVAFVGEAPGFNEDRQGRPFVGQAGSLLGELLESVGWRRQDVFITNVVKCRPPSNRDPEPDEIAACAPFLSRQLAVLDPALVVTLGRFSMARFSPGARIGQVHGTYRQADASSGAPEALCYAMYHPAAALHQGSLKQTLFEDMQGVPRALVAARDQREQRDAVATDLAEPAQARPAGSSVADKQAALAAPIGEPAAMAASATAQSADRPNATELGATAPGADQVAEAEVAAAPATGQSIDAGHSPEPAPAEASAAPDASPVQEADPLAQLTLF